MSHSCSDCSPDAHPHFLDPLWDRLGIGLSAVCLVHCLSLPVILSGAAIWAAVDWHAWLALLIVPLALVIAWNAHYSHRHRWVGPLLLIGCVALVGAILVDPYVTKALETGITVAGSLLLIAGHWLHIRYHRRTADGVETDPSNANHADAASSPAQKPA